MENSSLITKQDIAKYVQDMAEMEAKEFTLRKAAEKIYQEAVNIKRIAQDAHHNANELLSKAETELQNLTKQKASLGPSPIKPQAPLTLQLPSPPVLPTIPELPPKPSFPIKPDKWEEYQKKYSSGDIPQKQSKISIKVFLKRLPIILLVYVVLAIVPFFAFYESFLSILNQIASKNISLEAGLCIVLIITIIIIVSIDYILCRIELRGDNDYVSSELNLINECKQYESKLEEYKQFQERYEQRNKLISEASQLRNEYAKSCEKIKSENFKRENEYQSKHKEYTRHYEILQKLNTDIEAQKQKINQFHANLQSAQSKLPVAHMQADLMETQADMLIEKANEIQKAKLAIYKVNIVPPDYRELDCVLMFHQIFRNDLADTIREAIKIYEERIFRQEVIRGIDKIYAMLGNLSSAMNSIEKRLLEIKDEVIIMGNDVHKATSQLAGIALDNQNMMKKNEHVYRQSKFHRASSKVE